MSFLRNNFIFSVIYSIRHIFPQNNYLKSLQNKLAAIPQIKNGKITRLEIDRINDLSEEDFIKNYLNKNRPVVFNAQAKSWPCCQKWNLKYLEEGMKNISFRSFEDINPNSGELPDYESKDGVKITSPDLSKAIQDKQAYLRFSTVMDQHKSLLDDLDNSWLKKMRRGFFGICCQNFIGAKGRITTLHSGSTPFFYIMAFGEKKWVLTDTKNTRALNPHISHHSYYHTDVDLGNISEKNNPGLIGAAVYDCHLKQGDILFVPSWVWHQVENLTHSWGVSYNFTALRTFLRYPLFVFVRIFFRQPSFWATLVGTFNSKKISGMTENMPDFIHD